MGRVNTGDGQLSIWNVSWVARALLVDPGSVFDANIFYPHRHALAFSETNLGAGALGLLAYATTHDPYVTHNVAALLMFVLATIASYYLARYVSGHRGASMIAAVMFAFCPYVFARTAHIQLLATAGLPLSLLAFHRVVDRATVARAVALGLALVAQALACAYYGIFAGLTVAVGALFFAASRRRWRDPRYWAAFAGAAALVVLLLLPCYLPYQQIQREAGFVRTLDDARMYGAEWRAFFASAAWAHRWMHPLLGSWNEVLFPGFATLIFGTAGIWFVVRARPAGNARAAATGPAVKRDVALFYMIVGAVALWCAFGPAAGLYTLLYYTIPVFSFLRAPARFGVMVTLALSILSAVGIAQLVQDRRIAVQRLATAFLMIATVAELAVIPLPLPDALPVPRAYRHLAALPYGPVAEFPFFYTRPDFPRHAYYMLYSTYHWRPLINGYSDYIPPDFRQMAVPLSSFPTRESFAILEARRARYVVFHLGLYDSRSREKLLERIAQYQEYLRPLLQEDEVWLYEIVAWPR